MDRAKQWGPSPVKFVEMTEDSSLSGGISRDELRALGADTISDALGLEVLEVEHGRVVGRLPVDARTHQPYGLLHGGASVVLAETLGMSKITKTFPDLWVGFGSLLKIFGSSADL